LSELQRHFSLTISGKTEVHEFMMVVGRVQNPPNFFRSGEAVLAKISGAERSGGAEISEKSIF
jgi:hypothetical protein